MTDALHATLYSLAAFFLLTWGGNLAVRILFRVTGLRASTEPADTDETPLPPAGRIIGWLERVVLAAGILVQSWHIIAAVIALKTVARFKELDDKAFAEYFLVGSLFSIFWALLVTGLWALYDMTYGIGLGSLLIRAPD